MESERNNQSPERKKSEIVLPLIDRMAKYFWINEALRCIESATFDEGDTPIHKAS